MNEPYTTVPLSEIAEFAKLGIEYMNKEYTEQWEKRIAEELANKPKRGWLWNKRLVTREEIEEYLGKPEEGKSPVYTSVYYNIFGETKQYQDYQNFIEMHDTSPDKEVTLSVRSYNALMTFGEDV